MHSCCLGRLRTSRVGGDQHRSLHQCLVDSLSLASPTRRGMLGPPTRSPDIRGSRSSPDSHRTSYPARLCGADLASARPNAPAKECALSVLILSWFLQIKLALSR